MAELNKPIPNPFRAFSTMTYGISIYMQSPKHYANMIATKAKDVTGMELLIQSGGASSDAGTATTGNFGAIRNKFFTQDFYLDDIQFSSFIAGTSTGGPQNTFEIKFTVTEPMGLTFMDRLYRASSAYAANIGYTDFNPVNQMYLMVVRFYGYDEKGNQVRNANFVDTTDRDAYTEKWIPFMIRQIQFSVESSKVVYACECVAPQTQVGLGQVHGTIPFNLALQGNTLTDLLNGETSKNVNGVVTQGLMQALNRQQATLAKNKNYEYADRYAIEMPPEIANAIAFAPGTPIIQRSGTLGQAKSSDLALMSNGSAQAVKTVQTYATNAGMKIVKFIDLAIRSSSYIANQYKKTNDANKDGSTIFKQSNLNLLKWFKIRPRIEVLNFDKTRQRWSYKITYVVSVYDVATVDTSDFNPSSCFKIHKEYDYWFTGKNTEVLNFKQDYKTFYYTTFTDKHKENPEAAPKQQTNYNAQRSYRANSTESDQGSENKETEQAANAASILYAPQDIANCEIDIVGDPDWLAQSELFYAANTTPSDPVLDDGSINFDRAEVFFTVNFNTVVDYDLDTGLADVTQKNVGKRLDGAELGGVSQYAFVYRANTIISQFEKGKFTQQLKGTLVFLPEACFIGEAPTTAPVREKPTGVSGAINPGNSKVKGKVSNPKITGRMPNFAQGENIPKLAAPDIAATLNGPTNNLVESTSPQLSGPAARESHDPILNNLRK